MVARISLFGIILVAAFVARSLVLLGFLSVVIGSLLSFPVNFVNRMFPRGISVLIVLLTLLGIFIVFVVLALPIVSRQVVLLKDQVPLAAHKIQHWIAGAEKSAPALAPEGKLSDRSHPVISTAPQFSTQALSIMANVAESISAALLTLIVAVFLVYDPDGYRKGVRLFVPAPYEKVFDESSRRIGIGLNHWVGGIFIEMLIMGALAGLGLWIVGIEGALLLGLLTFVATFIPYLGAILSSIPGLLMGLAKSPNHFFYAAGIYTCVHIIEGYILSPFVMRRAIQLRPALLLLWQALMGILFGIIGVIVATPLLACLKALVGYIYVEGKLGKEAPKI